MSQTSDISIHQYLFSNCSFESEITFFITNILSNLVFELFSLIRNK